MQQTASYLLRAFTGSAIYVLAMHAGWAQGSMPDNGMHAGDPARWYQEDLTPRARFMTSKKEAGAAYREALSECKKIERAGRTACTREARAMFEQALAEARQKMQTSSR